MYAPANSYAHLTNHVFIISIICIFSWLLAYQYLQHVKSSSASMLEVDGTKVDIHVLLHDIYISKQAFNESLDFCNFRLIWPRSYEEDISNFCKTRVNCFTFSF